MTHLKHRSLAPVFIVEQRHTFIELYAHLRSLGRLTDLYAAKTEMKTPELDVLWVGGVTLDELNRHLEAALIPQSLASLEAQFGVEHVARVVQWLEDGNDLITLERLERGHVSPGELQNLIYGSWQLDGTPYDPMYTAHFEPVPPDHDLGVGPEALAKLLSPDFDQ